MLVQRTLEGRGTLIAGGRRHAVLPGQALVVAIPGPATWCYEGDGTPWRFAFASVTCPAPPDLSQRPVIAMEAGGVLERVHTALVEARLGGDFGHHAILAYQLLCGVVAAVRGTASTGSEARLAERIARAGGDCGIGGLARQLGRSHAGLTRRFAKRYGETPRAFAERLRLRTACVRLSSGATAVAAAAAAGYADPTHFGRAFRRRLGVPPARWASLPDELRPWP